MKSHLHITLQVNGEAVEVAFAPYKTLLEVLREDLSLTGTKHGCELGECGACAVLLDGEPVLSCLVLGVECEGRDVTTVEGLGGHDGRSTRCRRRSPISAPRSAATARRAFLLTAKALLDREPAPDARPDPRGAVGQSLPVHRIPADLRGGRGRRGAQRATAGAPTQLGETGDPRREVRKR